MTNLKLTPWFDGSIKPVRAGVYETSYGRSGYAYFDGKRWGWVNATVEQASKDQDTNGAFQRKRWRGLAEDPNK